LVEIVQYAASNAGDAGHGEMVVIDDEHENGEQGEDAGRGEMVMIGGEGEKGT